MYNDVILKLVVKVLKKADLKLKVSFKAKAPKLCIQCCLLADNSIIKVKSKKNVYVDI